MAKKGRKPKHYITSYGETIVGLGRRKDGRWYAIGEGKEIAPRTFSEKEAIQRFRLWEGKATAVDVDGMPHVEKVVSFDEIRQDETTGKWTVVVATRQKATAETYEIPEQGLIDIFVDWLTTKPKWLAERTGIEQLGYLRDIQKPVTLSLSTIAKTFSGKELSPREQKAVTNAWSDFSKRVSVANIDDIKESNIENYGRWLKKQRLAPKTIKNIIGKVRSVLNFAKPRHKTHLSRIDEILLDIQSLIELPKVHAPNPIALSRAEFQAILAASTDRFRSILLLSLNCALHIGELVAVRNAELLLTKQTFHSNRSKTGIYRIAYLWQETVDAMKKSADKGEYAFDCGQEVGDNWEPVAKQRIDREWKTTCNKAGLGDIPFGILRKSCRTYMRGDPEAAAFVMGHSFSGISDAYNARMRDDTKKVLEQVRKMYL